MRKIVLVATFLMVCTFNLAAQQQKNRFDAAKLVILWQPLSNSKEGLTRLTITNKSRQQLPASGWNIYFNASRDFITDSLKSHLAISHVNGDLFRIAPLPAFKGLKPNQSVGFDCISSYPVINFTDGPEGFYYVAGNESKGISINNFTTLPFPEAEAKSSKIGFITPEIIYEKNKNIIDIPAANLTKIFPSPVSYKETGNTFLLTATTSVEAGSMFGNEAQYLTRKLQEFVGTKIPTTISSSKDIIEIRQKQLNGDAYELHITNQKIEIDAGSSAGAFYGIQSLFSLMPADAWAGVQKNIAVTTVDVEDAPRFGYRAIMLDVARNFQPKQEIFKLLDAMALYKLNVLHLHFSDDEGWRVEIPSLPELTKVGSVRGHTLDNRQFLQPSHGSGPDISNAQGSGYYSKKDFIEILKYATERHITVIPEIETPGHARAAIKAMDARYETFLKAGNKAEAERFLLRDLNDESQYSSVQSWNDNVIDVSSPSAYRFIETVVSDIQKMYNEAGAPLETIHMGGDEVPAGVWEKSPAYLALQKTNSAVKSTDDLWYYFYGRVNKILKDHGLFLSGWEETAMRKTKLDDQKYYVPNPDFVNENFQADVWNNTIGGGSEDLAYKLANAGYKVVLSCVSNNYFDMSYYKNFDEPGYYWGGFTDIDKPFDFIPFDYFKNVKVGKDGNPVDPSIFIGKQRLTDFGKSNIVGIKGLLWEETIKSTGRMEYMMFPKLLALAERAWAKDPDWATEKDAVTADELYRQAISSFFNVVGKRELPRLNYYAGGFNYRIPAPGLIFDNGQVKINMQLPGFTLRYTTDGTEPTASSQVYTGPFVATGTIKVKAFNSEGRSGRAAVAKIR